MPSMLHPSTLGPRSPDWLTYSCGQDSPGSQTRDTETSLGFNRLHKHSSGNLEIDCRDTVVIKRQRYYKATWRGQEITLTEREATVLIALFDSSARIQFKPMQIGRYVWPVGGYPRYWTNMTTTIMVRLKRKMPGLVKITHAGYWLDP